MTSPTQMVVGKGIPNSLIAEGLLKILRDLSCLSLQNPFPIPSHGIVEPLKYLRSFTRQNEHRLVTLTVNL